MIMQRPATWEMTDFQSKEVLTDQREQFFSKKFPRLVKLAIERYRHFVALVKLYRPLMTLILSSLSFTITPTLFYFETLRKILKEWVFLYLVRF